MNNLLVRIFSLALVVNANTKYNVYVRYYGNCHCFDVDVDDGNYKPIKQWSLYLNTMELSEKLHEINEIRKYLEGLRSSE